MNRRESIVYEVSENGFRVVKRRIDDVGDSAGSADKLLGAMRRTLATAFGAVTLRQIARYADQFTSIQNLLRVTSNNTAELNKTTNDLFNISQRTRAPLEAITALYQKGSIAADELGASQDELKRFTENVGLALAQQSGGASQASGALLQLSQALGSGIVRAEEFNSILEGAFPIAQAAAKGLDAAGGSVSRLRQLVVSGQVTSREFFDALLSQSDALEKAFGKTVPTIGQSLIVLENSAIKAFGELNKNAGFTKALSTLIIGLAGSIDVLARAAAAAGITISAIFVRKGLLAATAGVKALGVAIAANPIGAIAIGITAAVSGLIAFSDKIKVSSDGMVTLSGFSSALFSEIGKSLSGIGSSISAAFKDVSGILGGFFGEFDISFESMIKTVAKFIDFQVGSFKAGYSVISDIVKNFPSVVLDAFVSQLNLTIKIVKNFANEVISILNLAGANISLISFDGLDNPAKNTLKNIARDANDVFLKALNEGPAQSLVNRAFESARSASVAQSSAKNSKSKVETNGFDLDALSAVARSLETEREKILREFEKRRKIIVNNTNAESETRINLLKRNDEKLKKALDSLTPVSTFTDLEKQLVLERNALEQNRNVRDAIAKVLSLENELRVSLTDTQRKSLISLATENKLLERRKSLEESIKSPTGDFGDRASDLRALIDTQKITREQAQQSLTDTFSPETFGFDAYLSNYQQTLEQISALRDNDLISDAQYHKARVDNALRFQNEQLSYAESFFGSLSKLQSNENSKAARIGKAAAVSLALVETYKAANSAYAAMAGIPYVGPALGAAAAGAAVAAGLQNVQQIRSQPTGFRTGGSFTVGGSGGADSQIVPIRATPGERVSVSTPQQIKRGEERQSENTGANITIVNVTDPKELDNYLSSTGSDEVFMNKIQANINEIKDLVANG